MTPRDLLLIQANKVFKTFGYRRANMGEVARAAGLSRQGLYHHFPDKVSLFCAVTEMLQMYTIKQSDAARNIARKHCASFEKVVTAMLAARFGGLLRAAENSPHQDEIFTEATKRCADIVTAHTARFHQMLVGAIKEEIHAGRFCLAEGISSDELASALTTMARGVNIKQPPPDTRSVRGEYARHVQLILRGARA